ncbi:MAG: Fur family transcriptional regulator [Anaerolineales bacterium]
MAHTQLVAKPDAAKRAGDWLSKLHSHGYRVTKSRRAVVDALAEADTSLTAADLYGIGRGRHKRLGLVSVYRTLEKLEELGLIQRLHRPDGCHTYISAMEGHQHLLLCQSCGRVEVFHGDDISDLSSRLERESGFEIRDHWLQFFGLCEKCRKIDT